MLVKELLFLAYGAMYLMGAKNLTSPATEQLFYTAGDVLLKVGHWCSQSGLGMLVLEGSRSTGERLAVALCGGRLRRAFHCRRRAWLLEQRPHRPTPSDMIRPTCRGFPARTA